MNAQQILPCFEEETVKPVALIAAVQAELDTLPAANKLHIMQDFQVMRAESDDATWFAFLKNWLDFGKVGKA